MYIYIYVIYIYIYMMMMMVMMMIMMMMIMMMMMLMLMMLMVMMMMMNRVRICLLTFICLSLCSDNAQPLVNGFRLSLQSHSSFYLPRRKQKRTAQQDITLQARLFHTYLCSCPTRHYLYTVTPRFTTVQHSPTISTEHGAVK